MVPFVVAVGKTNPLPFDDAGALSLLRRFFFLSGRSGLSSVPKEKLGWFPLVVAAVVSVFGGADSAFGGKLKPVAGGGVGFGPKLNPPGGGATGAAVRGAVVVVGAAAGGGAAEKMNAVAGAAAGGSGGAAVVGAANTKSLVFDSSLLSFFCFVSLGVSQAGQCVLDDSSLYAKQVLHCHLLAKALAKKFPQPSFRIMGRASPQVRHKRSMSSLT